MGVHLGGAKRPWPRRPELQSFLACALVLCTCQSETEEAPPPEVHVDAELHGYKALVEVGEELRYVLDDEIVIRVPDGAPELLLAHLETDRTNEIALPAPETRGDHRLYRLALETPPSTGVLVLRDAYDRALHTWPIETDVDLPASLKEILEQGDDEVSAAAIENALAALEPRARIVALVELARIQQRAGNAEAIIAAWDRAGEAALEAHVPTEASRCFRAAAHYAFRARSFHEALARIERADAVDGPIHNTSGLMRAVRYRALVARERGYYRDAETLLKRGLDDAWARGLDEDFVWLSDTLASLRVDLGQYEDALHDLERVGPQFMQGDAAQQLSYEGDMGWVLIRGMESGAFAWDHERPQRHFERARALARELRRTDSEANAISNLLYLAYLQGDSVGARTLLAELERVDPSRDGWPGRFADIVGGRMQLEAGDLRAALRTFENARTRSLAETDGMQSDYSWRAQYGVAETLHRAGDHEGAARAIEAAIAAMLDVAQRTDLRSSRGSFVADRGRLFADAVTWALELGRAATAFELAEMAHTQLLRAVETSVRTERLNTDEARRFDALRDEYLDLRDTLESEAAQRDLLAGVPLRRFEQQRAVLRRELADRFERAHAYLDEVAPVDSARISVEGVSQGMGDSDALVSVISLGPRHLSFLVRSHVVQFRWLEDPADALAGWSSLLVGIDHVYIVAATPGARHLHRSVDEVGDPWLGRFGISYLPHAGLLARHPRPLSGRPLVVADPDDDLPGARSEASRVASLLVAPVRLLGPEATRRPVLGAIDGAPLFHFAGHGRSEGDEPWDSYLDLANGESLALEDVLVARPSVGLVVLSGCETADVAGGEAIGLADAFVVAGAQVALAADGDLDDARARDFIETFYAAGGATDPVGAYRRTALSWLQRGAALEFRLLGTRSLQARSAEP